MSNAIERDSEEQFVDSHDQAPSVPAASEHDIPCVAPPAAKRQRITKKKIELAKRAELEAQGQLALPLTALSRRELRDQGLDHPTIQHIRRQAKRMNELRKEEIDAEAAMIEIEVTKKKLALAQEKARLDQLALELEQQKQEIQAARAEAASAHQHAQPITQQPTQQSQSQSFVYREPQQQPTMMHAVPMMMVPVQQQPIPTRKVEEQSGFAMTSPVPVVHQTMKPQVQKKIPTNTTSLFY